MHRVCKDAKACLSTRDDDEVFGSLASVPDRLCVEETLTGGCVCRHLHQASLVRRSRGGNSLEALVLRDESPGPREDGEAPQMFHSGACIPSRLRASIPLRAFHIPSMEQARVNFSRRITPRPGNAKQARWGAGVDGAGPGELFSCLRFLSLVR